MGDSAGRRADGHEFGTRLMPGGPLGSGIGDEGGDGLVGFPVGFAAAGVSLEWVPLRTTSGREAR